MAYFCRIQEGAAYWAFAWDVVVDFVVDVAWASSFVDVSCGVPSYHCSYPSAHWDPAWASRDPWDPCYCPFAFFAASSFVVDVAVVAAVVGSSWD